MLRKLANKYLSQNTRLALRSTLSAVRLRWIKTFLSYDGEDLKRALKACGIESSDTIMIHANFKPDSGFRGAPKDVVTALLEFIGDSGNLLMVSIPFRGSAYDYLLQKKTFNVKKTMSMMGLVTESFRRREGTLRSLHPTHPVLAAGRNAAQIVNGHERCLFPCGVGTPFEKFVDHKGKLVFFDVGFGAITFFHYVEDVIKSKVPFPVYEDTLFEVPVIDSGGQSGHVKTYAFNRNVKRDTDKVLKEMQDSRLVHTRRVGNSSILVVNAADVLEAMQRLVDAEDYPYVALGAED